MIIDKIGHIQNNFYYLGLIECPIFLLDGPEPVIFDAGVTCAGKIYVEAIRSIWAKGSRPGFASPMSIGIIAELQPTCKKPSRI